MKITKTKEVITEEIELKAGTYYFEDDNMIVHKLVLGEDEDNMIDYKLESVRNFSNIYSVTVKDDSAWDEDDLPYVVKQFFIGAAKKIEKEEYYRERAELLERIS